MIFVFARFRYDDFSFNLDLFDHSEKLEKLGFEVKLRRTIDYEMVIFAFEGHTVFTCLATNLSVLGCSTYDPTACRLIKLMLAERNHAKLRCKLC
ncbi:unnamed protein product [Macrosiphum euphorbiae]|uniref:Uncharacterized protein n=1 Tax=Macrosiphum euphorbiae TaxID=13131 RepID=A0AAV0XJH4_9HEMI|nr:unnamed protein product [Macrosiphum euphorbiae]